VTSPTQLRIQLNSTAQHTSCALRRIRLHPHPLVLAAQRPPSGSLLQPASAAPVPSVPTAPLCVWLARLSSYLMLHPAGNGGALVTM
jgi:hypothetical protein